MTKKYVEQVYAYIRKYCKFGVHPHQLAKALGISEAAVMEALKELESLGKITLRSVNVEWKSRSRRWR